jgi:signal transduction histidine kinase
MERPDGRAIDYATVPLPDGQTMVTFVDVTDSIKVERALRERNEALEAADALKNAFIHHVSYELRSPLTNIMGFAQMLSDARVGALNDRQREYTGYIMASSETLLAIVNDILDLSSIDAGIMDLDLGEVDVTDAVSAAIDSLTERMHDAHVRITADISPGIGRIVADEKRLRQIVYNLLSNAVLFSPENTVVRLSARRDGDFVEITVADRGVGIPTAFLNSVFDRFAAMPRGAARGGAGLGLAIVKSFVGLHGGTVEISSEEGRGTVARVRLPIRPMLDAAAAE